LANLKRERNIPGGAQTGILRFPIENFVYKWLQWVLKLLLFLITKQFPANTNNKNETSTTVTVDCT